MSKPKTMILVALAALVLANAQELAAGAIFQVDAEEGAGLLKAETARPATDAEAEQFAADQATAEAAAKAAAKANGKKVEARVLVDCAHGAANSVAELDPDTAKQAEREGLVDTTPAAVKYAKSEAAAKAKAKANA